eukprot:TRINITY_DN40280_c0_g1_i1.p1 TRINITY_DN40280_c0_g1~~TRINITY_DN40280_c0_g1_i1.p1  ORF type:complete len:1045 (+),score=167.36 TRINITY_DN40280_c0_g1_i1:81-3215(+)
MLGISKWRPRNDRSRPSSAGAGNGCCTQQRVRGAWQSSPQLVNGPGDPEARVASRLSALVSMRGRVPGQLFADMQPPAQHVASAQAQAALPAASAKKKPSPAVRPQSAHRSPRPQQFPVSPKPVYLGREARVDDNLESEQRVRGRCAVCSLDPLVFLECPACAARYCASGCLQSWYEHSRASRSNPVEAEIVSTDSADPDISTDYINVSFRESVMNGVFQEAEEVELALTRLGNNCIIGESTCVGDSGAGRGRRWSISAVDGWSIGMSAPGPRWRPSPGVVLTLEELGQCLSCSRRVAVKEYVCNGAVAANGDSRKHSAAEYPGRYVRKPRPHVAEAATQTIRNVFRDGSSQTGGHTVLVDVGVQASVEKRDLADATRRALAVASAVSLAQLAAPVAVPTGVLATVTSATDACGDDGAIDRSEHGGGVNGGSMLLTASPESARRRVRVAMAALAKLSVLDDVVMVAAAATGPSDSEAALRTAEAAVKLVAGHPADDHETHVQGSNKVWACRGGRGRRRVLGHARCCAATACGAASGAADASGARAATFAAGALEALRWRGIASKARQPAAMASAMLPAASDVTPGQRVDDADSILLGFALGSVGCDEAGFEREDDFVCDALANTAALTCIERGVDAFPNDIAQALLPFAAVARLLEPPTSSQWRSVAAAESWPWATSESDESPTPTPRGWAELHDALNALRALVEIAEDPLQNCTSDFDRQESRRGLLASAVKAVASLALFVDHDIASVEAMDTAAGGSALEAREAGNSQGSAKFLVRPAALDTEVEAGPTALSPGVSYSSLSPKSALKVSAASTVTSPLQKPTSPHDPRSNRISSPSVRWDIEGKGRNASSNGVCASAASTPGAGDLGAVFAENSTSVSNCRGGSPGGKDDGAATCNAAETIAVAMARGACAGDASGDGGSNQTSPHGKTSSFNLSDRGVAEGGQLNFGLSRSPIGSILGGSGRLPKGRIGGCGAGPSFGGDGSSGGSCPSGGVDDGLRGGGGVLGGGGGLGGCGGRLSGGGVGEVNRKGMQSAMNDLFKRKK